MKIKQTKSDTVFSIVNAVFLLICILLVVYPFMYILSVSVSSYNEVLRGNVVLFPRGFQFDAFQQALKDQKLLQGIGNSLLYMTVGTTINLVMTMCCAYPLSKKGLPGRKFFSMMILITMFFSGGMIPRFMVVNMLGLFDTIFAMVLPGAIITFYMILARSFFEGIPTALEESAKLDGSNDIQTLVLIYLPLSTPIIATLLIYYAVNHWNDFMTGLLYLQTEAKYPLQMVLRDIVVRGASDSGITNAELMNISEESIKYASIIISILPVIAIYPFVQKYFVKGVMVGSIKG